MTWTIVDIFQTAGRHFTVHAYNCGCPNRSFGKRTVCAYPITSRRDAREVVADADVSFGACTAAIHGR